MSKSVTGVCDRTGAAARIAACLTTLPSAQPDLLGLLASVLMFTRTKCLLCKRLRKAFKKASHFFFFFPPVRAFNYKTQ